MPRRSGTLTYYNSGTAQDLYILLPETLPIPADGASARTDLPHSVDLGQHQRPRVGKADSLARIAAAFCGIFGLLHILNVHPVGDGIWFWYATALRHGQHLYSDLHLPMQPLFVFATEWNQRLLGTTWLASKVLACLQDGLYCWGIYLVSRYIPLPDSLRALLIAAVFGTTIVAPYYRFDDYHVTGHALVLFSIYLCLKLYREERIARTLQYAVALGVFAGVSMGNRLNDGALLCLASGFAVAVLAQRRRFQAFALFALSAVASLVLVVLLTGDSLKSWANETIFHAATIKGGTGHIFYAPFHFPFATFHHLTSDHVYLRNLITACAVILLITLGKYLVRTGGRTRLLGNAVFLVGSLGALYVIRQANAGISILAIADGLILLCYAAFLVLTLRLVWMLLCGKRSQWNRWEVLILFPFGQILAGAMTSGQSFLEAYPALAILLLVSPFLFPRLNFDRVWRDSLVTLLLLLAAGSAVSKWSRPYYWHHFNNAPMFSSRLWYTHPSFGPMYVERNHLQLMQGMCNVVNGGGKQPTELLAMPWPYPNYFCNVPPWHGYVQTWYDTTSAATVSKLVAELQDHPPEWIAYQRALDSFVAHEVVFLGGGTLPHRALDRTIVDRLQSGAWTLRFQQCFSGADWLLIHTRPAAAGEPNDILIPSDDRTNLCSRTDHKVLR